MSEKINENIIPKSADLHNASETDIIQETQNPVSKNSIVEDKSSEIKKFGIISSGVYLYFIIITGIINISIIPISDGKSALETLMGPSGDFVYFLGNLLAASCLWFIPYYLVVFIVSIIVSIIKFELIFVQSKWFLILPILFQLLVIAGTFV